MQHFVNINQLSDAQLEHLLKKTADYKSRIMQVEPLDLLKQSLAGKIIVNLFYEASTRTRVSFEVAARRLGAEVINISAAASSLGKGETLADTLETLAAIGADAVVIRHPQTGVLNELLAANKIPLALVNAGDGCGQHPSQALLDAATLQAACGRLEGLKIVIAGDIRHSRVAASNLQLLARLGVSDIRLVGPKQLLPLEPPAQVTLMTEDFDQALIGADIVMMLRIQHERIQGLELPQAEAYYRSWGLDQDRLELANSKCLVMHPGPVNRGVEISDEVADGPQSLIRQQVAMGVAARMAIFSSLIAQEQ